MARPCPGHQRLCERFRKMPQADPINEKRENHAALHILAHVAFGSRYSLRLYDERDATIHAPTGVK